MKLALLGASGHGKVIADIASLVGYSEVIFYDDAWPEKQKCGQWPIVGGTQELVQAKRTFERCIVSIGNNSIRLNKQDFLRSQGIAIATLIHPNSIISPSVMIAEGAVVMAGAIINADAEIGRGCIINTGAVVEHDCKLSAGVHISPGACLAGAVSVGEGCWVAMGASVLQCLNIGANSTIGAGAVVIKNVPDGATMVGVPAQLLKK